MDSHIPRPLTLSDLWLPGDVLGGAMLTGWRGEVWHRDGDDWQRSIVGGYLTQAGYEADPRVMLIARGPNLGRLEVPPDEVAFDCTRTEVRDRAVRIIGPDALPIHAAELRGDITPGEAAGLVWCSVLRREAGMPVPHMLNVWCEPNPWPNWYARRTLTGVGGIALDPTCWVSLGPDATSGRETGEAGRAAADAAALAAGYALREPDGILLLPLPDGIGRLETSNG